MGAIFRTGTHLEAQPAEGVAAAALLPLAFHVHAALRLVDQPPAVRAGLRTCRPSDDPARGPVAECRSTLGRPRHTHTHARARTHAHTTPDPPKRVVRGLFRV